MDTADKVLLGIGGWFALSILAGAFWARLRAPVRELEQLEDRREVYADTAKVAEEAFFALGDPELIDIAREAWFLAGETLVLEHGHTKTDTSFYDQFLEEDDL